MRQKCHLVDTRKTLFQKDFLEYYLRTFPSQGWIDWDVINIKKIKRSQLWDRNTIAFDR